MAHGMPEKSPKMLSLTEEVQERLEEVSVQSHFVEELLREEFGMDPLNPDVLLTESRVQSPDLNRTTRREIERKPTEITQEE